MRPAVPQRRARPTCESIEQRLLLATFTVTSAADSGPGSLRSAILSVNDDFTPAVIDFQIGTSGNQRIVLASALPDVTNTVTIDGTTQPGYSPQSMIPLIVIDGSRTGDPGANGLSIVSSDSIVQGLAIVNSGASGISVSGNHVSLRSNYIGFDPIARTVGPNGGDGITLGLFTTNEVIGGPGAGNLIVGSLGSGINLPLLSTGDLIQGNIIGTAPLGGGGSGIVLGALNLGNGGDGINIGGRSGSITIGGSVAGAGNVISGSVGNGIHIDGGSNNLILGNRIGTDAAGANPVTNGGDGILINKSNGNTIGGTAPGAGNLISGSALDGIQVFASSRTLIQGNKIGTNLAGLAPIPNANNGILLEQSPHSTVGGSTTGAGNVVSGNSFNGVNIDQPTATGNLVQGNFIGVDANGEGFLGNSGNGIRVKNAPGNSILDNVISSNNFAGIFLNGSNSSGNLIRGNLIGTNAKGDQLSNLTDGVFIIQAPNNTIGGTTSLDRNVISANTNNGVSIRGPLATGNLVQGNYIGTDPTGRLNLGNVTDGVFIQNSSGNTIGGTTPGSGNVIAKNRIGVDIQTVSDANLGQAGGVFSGGRSDHNLVEGNLIGLDASGTVGLGNSAEGVLIVQGSNNQIGGTAPGAGNVIAGNLTNGVGIESGGSDLAPSTGNLIEGNKIGTAIDGLTPIGNRANGIFVADSPSNSIGGTASGAGNVIASNSVNGIIISGASGGTVILGNLIGVDVTGLGQLGNSQNGVDVEGASGVTVGSSAGLGRNVISGNGSSGIQFGTASTRDLVENNLIGVAADGRTPRPNNQSGIFLAQGSTQVTIGGTTPGSRNVISGNSIGVTITNPGTSDNRIEGNFIGLALDGSTSVGNLSYGVILLNGVTGNVIGGTDPSSGNVISSNGQGVGIIGPNSTGNLVAGNIIGLDASGVSPKGNLQLGVFLNGASGNTIGGSTSGSGNVISGNTGVGLELFGAGSSGNLVAGNLVGLDATGSTTTGPTGQSLGNSTFGIQIQDAGFNTIGGTTPGSRNVVSGNRQAGIALSGSRAAFNVVQGNYVGLDANGSVALGNLADGILLDNAPANLIGGTSASSRNVISANHGSGVEVLGVGSLYDQILANYIGTDASGLLALGNGQSGILIDSAPGVVVGGTIDALGNVISGNGRDGVRVVGSRSSGTQILGNRIGIGSDGRTDLGNGNDGVLLDSAVAVTIGGTAVGSGNVISGNAGAGVEFGGGSTLLDFVQGNVIGADSTGKIAVGNSTGVLVNGSPFNTIGGIIGGSGNLISGNFGPGVHVLGAGSRGVGILGNRIGVDVSGGSRLANASGVFIDGSPSNLVAGNQISGNTGDGVVIAGAASTFNVVQGNLVGVDATGTRAIGSGSTQQSGILVLDAPRNIVGGLSASNRNVVSGNVVGVVIAGFNAQGNIVLGNFIGVDARGLAAIPNSTGVYVNGSSTNIIGGTQPGSANVISGNTVTGVDLYGIQSIGNAVQGNFIGTNAFGLAAVPNGSGVYVELATSNTIGGSTAAAGNLISGNTVAGVYFFNGAASNLIQRNKIGVSAAGKKLANLQYGVLFFNAANNILDKSPGTGNIIANSGIGNFREFTGKVLPATTTTTKKPKAKAIHPTGPRASTR